MKKNNLASIATRTTNKPCLTTEERFRSHIGTPDANGCESWKAATSESGYGLFRAHGTIVYAHRYAYQLHHKLDAIPDGLCVLHSCDNRLCTAKAHLRLGTNRENSADMVQRGRSTKGRSIPRKRFTKDEITTLVQMAATGSSQYLIAKTLQRSEPAVSYALKRNAALIDAKKAEIFKKKLVSMLEPVNKLMKTCIAELEEVTGKAA